VAWGDKGHHVGIIGKSTKEAKQNPFLHAKTAFVKNDETIIELAAATGIKDLRLIYHSLDGRCWYAEGTESDEDNPRRYIITLARNKDTGKIEYRDYAVVPNINGYGAIRPQEVFQIGRDWILMEYTFWSAHNETGMVNKVDIRVSNTNNRPPNLSQSTYYGLGYASETGWLYRDSQSTGSPPYWEQLNKVFGGFQIVHGWLIPRADYGRDLVSTTNNVSAEWSNYAIPYDVLESGAQTSTSIYFQDIGDDGGTVDLTGYGHRLKHTELEEVEADKYGVFVVDDEIFVKTASFAGHGIFVPAYWKFNGTEEEGSEVFHKSFHLIQTNDYNVKKSKYSGFKWDDAIIGKIGDTVALIEIEVKSIDAKIPPVMYVSATGRYIPLSVKVKPENAGDDNVPLIEQMTGPEQENLSFYINCGVTGFPAPSLGKNDDVLVLYGTDSDGEEEMSAYKGANRHFFPGKSKLIGMYGPYIISTDGYQNTFITDTEGPFFRMLYRGRGDIAIEYNVIDDTVKSALSLCLVYGDAAILFNTMYQSDSAPKYSDYEEEWKSADGNPFNFRLLKCEMWDGDDGFYAITFCPVVRYPSIPVSYDEGYKAFCRSWGATTGSGSFGSGEKPSYMSGESSDTFGVIDPDTGELTRYTFKSHFEITELFVVQDKFEPIVDGCRGVYSKSVPWAEGEGGLEVTGDSAWGQKRGIMFRMVDGKFEMHRQRIQYGHWSKFMGEEESFSREFELSPEGLWIIPGETYWYASPAGSPTSSKYESMQEVWSQNIVGLPNGSSSGVSDWLYRISYITHCMTNEFWDLILEKQDTVTSRTYLTPETAVDPAFNMSAMDIPLTIRVEPNETIMKNIIADSDYIRNSRNTCVSRRHHLNQHYEGLFKLPAYYPDALPLDEILLESPAYSSPKILAHFTNEFFKVNPLYFDYSTGKQEVPIWRAKNQLYIFSAPKGITLQNTQSGAPSCPFSKNYYIAMRCDVDVDKYNAIVDILRGNP
jgi:hypothetical protein